MDGSVQEIGAIAHLARPADRSAWDRFRFHPLDSLRRGLCALHGHDQLLQFEPDRMFLRCASCGFETPGWQVGRKPPRVRFRSEAREWLASHRLAAYDRKIA